MPPRKPLAKKSKSATESKAKPNKAARGVPAHEATADEEAPPPLRRWPRSSHTVTSDTESSESGTDNAKPIPKRLGRPPGKKGHAAAASTANKTTKKVKRPIVLGKKRARGEPSDEAKDTSESSSFSDVSFSTSTEDDEESWDNASAATATPSAGKRIAGGKADKRAPPLANGKKAAVVLTSATTATPMALSTTRGGMIIPQDDDEDDDPPLLAATRSAGPAHSPPGLASPQLLPSSRPPLSDDNDDIDLLAFTTNQVVPTTTVSPAASISPTRIPLTQSGPLFPASMYESPVRMPMHSSSVAHPRSPSTTYICKQAAEKPVEAPGTLWVALDDDDEDIFEPLTQRLASTSTLNQHSPMTRFSGGSAASAASSKYMSSSNNVALTQALPPSPSTARASPSLAVVFGTRGREGSTSNAYLAPAGGSGGVGGSSGKDGRHYPYRGIDPSLALPSLGMLKERSFSRDVSCGSQAIIQPKSPTMPYTFRERKSGGLGSASEVKSGSSSNQHSANNKSAAVASAPLVDKSKHVDRHSGGERMRPPSLPPRPTAHPSHAISRHAAMVASLPVTQRTVIDLDDDDTISNGSSNNNAHNLAMLGEETRVLEPGHYFGDAKAPVSSTKDWDVGAGSSGSPSLLPADYASVMPTQLQFPSALQGPSHARSTALQREPSAEVSMPSAQPTAATLPPLPTQKSTTSYFESQSSYFSPDKSPNDSASGGPRSVDEALAGLFPATFTKEQYIADARAIILGDNCLKRGQFWEAMDSVEYVGEGSFGLVWRCRTVEGDIVAVKSCPVSFASPEAIDDAYSILREISIMRFLNEKQVPYVLPLHAAFWCESNEALPPSILASIAAREEAQAAEKKMKAAETALKKATTLAENKLRKKLIADAKKAGGSAAATACKGPAFEAKLASLVASEVEVAKAKHRFEEEQFMKTSFTTAADMAKDCAGRLPKFIAIDEEGAMRCDATIFLVIDLCDGDLDGIEKNEAVTKRVAFCISTALNAMHGLGLVHLDLKPANILYAFDRSGDSAAQSSGIGGGGGAVKFVLSDFGNCQIVGQSYSDTVQPCLGTYEYMDMEALKIRSCSRATDCFSLGCTLYELMTGKRYIAGCKAKACKDIHSPRSCYVPLFEKRVLPDLSSWAVSAAARGPGSTTTANGNTVLSGIVKELLHFSREERMTAYGCYSRLVEAFGVATVAAPPK